MLEYKRALLVGMASEADSVLLRRRPYLLRLDGAVRVVAVDALDQPFIHAMMKRHVELWFLLEMARVAELWRGFHQQVLSCCRMVRRVAGDATHVVLRVHRIDRIHVLRAAGVAREAASVNLFGGGFFEEEELGGIRRVRDVSSGGAVAIFAAVLSDSTFFQSLLPVRARFPALVDVFMAGLAGFCAGVFVWDGGCGGRSVRLRRGFRLSLERRSDAAQQNENGP